MLVLQNANEDKKKELMELLIKDEDMSKSIDALYHERGELVVSLSLKGDFEKDLRKFGTY